MNPVLKNDIASEASSVGAMSFSSNRMNPKISVVMPFYNSEKYLREAVQSILDQSFSDFELILINDGSTDSSREIAASFKDTRIVLIDNPGNLGLSKSFNSGIKAAKGEFIARMDADDISLTKRFETQIDFLNHNIDIDVLGTAIILIDESGHPYGRSLKPLRHIEIKWQSLFSTPVFHPTVMARSRILKSNLFDESLHNSEDYELWSRLLFLEGCKFANLREPLILYRVFSNSFTRKLSLERRLISVRNSLNNIGKYVPISHYEREIFVKATTKKPMTATEWFDILKFYWNIRKHFIIKESFTPSLKPFLFDLVTRFLK